jgi:hypothetical protein
VPTQGKGAGRLRLLFTALIVTSISVVGAVGTAYATPQPTTGVLEICKAKSKGVAGSFGFTIQGRTGVIQVPVDGCSFPIKLSAGEVTVTEVARPGYSVAAIAANDRANDRRLLGWDLAKGSATVRIVPGGVSNQTILTFTNKATPKGYLQICKAKSSPTEQLSGDFFFTVSQPGRPTLTVPVPVGGCTLRPLQLAAGPATVTEVARRDVQLVGVTITPTGRGVVDLRRRTATVTIVAGEPATQTIVVFTNKKLPPPPPPTGQVKVCKHAGGDVAKGTNFSFTLANGIAKTVKVKVGSCSTPQKVPAGDLTVTEKPTAGLQVSKIKVLPTTAVRGGPDLTAGTVMVAVRAGKLTEVHFTNRKTPPGTIKVCKVAGHGVVPRTPFNFTVGTTPVKVLAGSCSLPLTRPATELMVSEAATDGMGVADIAVVGGGSLVSKNLRAGSARVQVASGLVTEVVFINTKPHTPVTGCLKPWQHYRNHGGDLEDLVPDAGLLVGSDALTAAQVQAALRANRGDLRLGLQSELIAALLNQLSGASTPTEVQAAIDAAQMYLSQGDGALANGALNTTSNSRHTEVSYNGRTYKASHLSGTLRNYNGGKSKGGPRPCRKPWGDDHKDGKDYKDVDGHDHGKDKKHDRKWRHYSRFCWPI